MTNYYDFEESQTIGAEAVKIVRSFLEKAHQSKIWYRTLHILDVQHTKEIQPLGIDLICFVEALEQVCCIALEVKGDRYHYTGNFFIETISNVRAGTPGAFVSCQAEWYCYCFNEVREIYFLPMVEARKWFLKNEQRFSLRYTNSEREGVRWKTAGKLVPRRVLCSEVTGVLHFKEVDGQWSRVEKELNDLL